jgi:hypothetical protein
MQIPSDKTRQISSDLALKILNSGTENGKPSQSVTRSSQSPSVSSGTLGASKSQANVAAAWTHNLPPVSGPAGTQQVWTQTPRLDVTSTSFKDYLAGAQEKAKEWCSYSGEVLDALNAGTLTIESPETNAWDIDFVDKDGTTIGWTMAYDEKAWRDFLEDHVARDENGNYARTASGAYLDKATGQSADMGQIGGNFYYMTWPTPE